MLGGGVEGGMHTTDSGLTPAIPDYAVPASGTRADPACAPQVFHMSGQKPGPASGTRADPACAGEGGGSPAGDTETHVVGPAGTARPGTCHDRFCGDGGGRRLDGDRRQGGRAVCDARDSPDQENAFTIC